MAQDIIASLTDLVQAPTKGTLFTAVVEKVGCSRGSGSAKVTFGNDTVRVLLWTGFSYGDLITRSMKSLDQQLNRGGYIERLTRATLKEHPDTTIADVCHALQEVRAGFRAKLYNQKDDSMIPPSPGVWEPLRIQGVAVKGCMVYQGQPEIPGVDIQAPLNAPKKGTVYIRGLKLAEQVLIPAPHGRWVANSGPRVIAKGIIKDDLPIGLYAQYRLDPERVRDVAVGDAAIAVAREHHIPIDAGILVSLI